MTTKKQNFIYEGFSSPNGTIVPDDVFDVLMPQLTEAELRVLLYIVRRTFGFKKPSDAISLSQMVHGIKTREGRVLDQGTGMTRRGVVRGIRRLIDKGVIEVRRGISAQGNNQVNSYSLRFKSAKTEGVGNKGPYARDRRSLALGTEVPPQTTVSQQTERQDNVGIKNGDDTMKPAGQIEYLVSEIEEVTGDNHSRPMFRALAATLPDPVVFQILSEIKQGEDIRNRGAIFVSAAKQWLERRKGDA